MAHRAKNLKLVEQCGNFLFKKLASAGWLFHIQMYRLAEEGAESFLVTNIGDHEQARKIGAVLATPGAKIIATKFYLDPQGVAHTEAIAASEEKIAADAKAAANTPAPIQTEGPRGIYRPDTGWK